MMHATGYGIGSLKAQSKAKIMRTITPEIRSVLVSFTVLCDMAFVSHNKYIEKINVGKSDLHMHAVRSGSELNCQVIRNFYWQSVSRDDVDKARILLELLFVRLGNFRLSNFDVHSLIVALCTE